MDWICLGVKILLDFVFEILFFVNVKVEGFYAEDEGGGDASWKM